MHIALAKALVINYFHIVGIFISQETFKFIRYTLRINNVYAQRIFMYQYPLSNKYIFACFIVLDLCVVVGVPYN